MMMVGDNLAQILACPAAQTSPWLSLPRNAGADSLWVEGPRSEAARSGIGATLSPSGSRRSRTPPSCAISIENPGGQLWVNCVGFAPTERVSAVGVDQDHQVVSEPRIFDIGVLAVACDFPRSFQHFVNLIEVEDY